MQKTSQILNRRLQQHGIKDMIDAAGVCSEAEKILPGLFTAISVRQSRTGEVTLHLQLKKENLIALKMQQGTLLTRLNAFAKTRRHPDITRIRLTFLEKPDIL